MISDFYKANRYQFEFTGILLVLAGLFLSLEETASILNIVIRQLVFILLAASCAMLIYIILCATRFFRDRVTQEQLRSLTQVQERTASLVEGDWGKLAAIRKGANEVWRGFNKVFIAYLVFILFLSNLFAFLFFAYPKESTFSMVALASWAIALGVRTQKFEILLLKILMQIGVRSSLVLVGMQILLSFIFLLLIPFLSYLYFVWDLSWCKCLDF